MKPPTTVEQWEQLAETAALRFPMQSDELDHALFEDSAYRQWSVQDVFETFALIFGFEPGEPLAEHRVDAEIAASALMAAVRQGIGIGLVMAQEGMLDDS